MPSRKNGRDNRGGVAPDQREHVALLEWAVEHRRWLRSYVDLAREAARGDIERVPPHGLFNREAFDQVLAKRAGALAARQRLREEWESATMPRMEARRRYEAEAVDLLADHVRALKHGKIETPGRLDSVAFYVQGARDIYTNASPDPSAPVDRRQMLAQVRRLIEKRGELASGPVKQAEAIVAMCVGDLDPDTVSDDRAIIRGLGKEWSAAKVKRGPERG